MPEHNPGQMGGTMRLGKRRTLFQTKNSVMSKSCLPGPLFGPACPGRMSCAGAVAPESQAGTFGLVLAFEVVFSLPSHVLWGRTVIAKAAVWV